MLLGGLVATICGLRLGTSDGDDDLLAVLPSLLLGMTLLEISVGMVGIIVGRILGSIDGTLLGRSDGTILGASVGGDFMSMVVGEADGCSD